MPHIVPTIHPAAQLRSTRPIVEAIRHDLAKVYRISNEGPGQFENIVAVIPYWRQPVEELTSIALAWMDRWLSIKCPVAVDVETSSLDYFNCKLYSIALSGEDGGNTAVAFSLADKKSLPWDAELALTQKTKQILADPLIPKVFHNAPYDFAVLTIKNMPVEGPIEDTMAYHHIIQPDIPHDLGWVGHTYLDVEPWKLNHDGSKMAFTDDLAELLIYNGKDALNTIKLRSPLLHEAYARGATSELLYYQLEMAKLAARMELVGIPINFQRRNAMGQELLDRLELLLYRMRQYLKWPDFNPMAKAHTVEALYNRKYLGLMPTAWTAKTKQPSTKYEHLIEHMEHPFIKDLIEYVENHHVYAGQYRDDPPGSYRRAMRSDGRLHPNWKYTGTKGSRYSSQPNCQNQRVKDRAFFEAPPGRVLVGSDKAALELRIAVALAGERELMDELAKPDGDPHLLAAIAVYGEDFLKKDPKVRKRLRDTIKTTVYASLYRAGIDTVFKSIRKKKFLDPALRASLTRDVVAHIYHSYFGRFKKFVEYHDNNYKKASTQGFLEIPPFKRRRYFPVQPPPYTEVANWEIQCCGSDVVGKQLVDVQHELDASVPDAHVIIHGHDALAVECWEKDAERVKYYIESIFGHFILDGPEGSVDLTADAKIGRTLKDVK